MSGIAGIIRFDGGTVDPGLIARMTQTMAHRGPNGIRHLLLGSVGLGHCMLHTTPESLQETQPLANDDESLVLVMDGWLENYEELRRELLSRGARLRNRSDAELVLRAYETWGEDCVTHIDGECAFVIWDARKRAAFLALDRAGLKQLHYAWDGKVLVFSTELRPALELPWIAPDLNEGYLAECFANRWEIGDETPYLSIRKMMPAHVLSLKDASLQKRRYWSMPLEADLSHESDADLVHHYRELLNDCVLRASRSAKPLACEASGGLDSSAIFAIADAQLRAGSLPAPDLRGYMVGFDDDTHADERRYARALAEHVGRPITEVPPFIPPVNWFEDRGRRLKNLSCFPNQAMSENMRTRIARDGSSIVLNGEGGDEWLTGYRLYYAEELAAGRFLSVLACLKADAAAAGVPRALYWLVRHGLFQVMPERIRSAARKALAFARSDRLEMPTWLADRTRALLEQRPERVSAYQFQEVTRAGQRPLLVNMDNSFGKVCFEHAEQLYAEHGIELRSPLYSRRMMEFACAIPERVRLTGHTTKLLHRRALSSHLPSIVLDRTDKAEFSVTTRRQLSGLQTVLCEIIPSVQPSWVERDGLVKLYSRAEAGEPLVWELWSIFLASTALKQMSA